MREKKEERKAATREIERKEKRRKNSPFKKKNRFPDFEKCAFLNAALAQLWPYVCLAAAEAARDLINPLLEEQRPPWLTRIAITKFELGPRPPTLEGIKVFPPSSPPALSRQHYRRDDGADADAADAAVDAASIGGQRGPPSQQSDAVVIEVDVYWAGAQGELSLFYLRFPSFLFF